MPEMKEVPFLKGEDIEEGKTPTVTFLAPHEDLTPEETGLDKEISQILVELEGKGKRVWTMNKSSQRIIISLHGSNSDAWVGKKVKVYCLAQNVRGEIKKVIYAKGEKV